MDHNIMQKQNNPFNSITVEISVSVGTARLCVRDLLEIEESSILPLNRKIDDPVELYVGSKLIAKGQLEQTEDSDSGQLSVRLTEVVTSEHQNG